MAGFGKPIEPQTSAEQSANEEARKNKRFSELLADLYGNKKQERFRGFAFPEDIKTNLNDVFDSYRVEKATRSTLRRKISEITVVPANVEGAHIRVTKNTVKADMSKLDIAAKTQTALEMAMIAANNPNLMSAEGGIPLQGSAEEKLALYLAAEKLGFAEKIDKTSMENVQELPPEKQQEVGEAIESSWAKTKENLAGFAANAADNEHDKDAEIGATGNQEEKPMKGKPEQDDFQKAAAGAGGQENKPEKPAPDINRIKGDFDQPIGGILNFYHQNYDKEAVETIKTKLLALHYFEKDTGADILPKFRSNIDFKSDKINSVEALESFMSEQQVPAEFIKKAEDEVAAWKPAPDGFPKMGEIADGYGYTDPLVKEELLIAQAAIRTMDRVQRMQSGNATLETQENKKSFSHLGKFKDESAELAQAQSLYALATCAEQTQAQGIDLDVKLPDVENMHTQATTILHNCYGTLHNMGELKAAEALKAVYESYKPTEQSLDNKEKPAAESGGLARRGLNPNNG